MVEIILIRAVVLTIRSIIAYKMNHGVEQIAPLIIMCLNCSYFPHVKRIYFILQQDS